ncbi:RanGAP1 C-terminal domain [Popillia japonica]|uniref:RanGAP1 C-terminal domain n=1 Tax=Popillia japonica TaxID=7064 RepID=A0AAW1LDX2_POPJA
MVSIEDVTEALENTRVTSSGVSFAGKSLKLDTENDAKPVIDAINGCNNLQYLNLEGNTLGVDASKAIAGALEKHPEFKKALWKDMFTGRMKTEIPKALQFLGNALVAAGARLTELDLSDNAFGPIGVEGLASLLKSSSCYGLEELRLNNNGLGIGGGKLLAKALLDCYECSKNEGKPLALKVFIAGRNRLENDGAKALAEVFNTIGTLEEIAMPQNGIYHPGISALSDAFKNNKNLQILNLNDNTIGPTGSKTIANILPALQNLKEINFGDCLLKNDGAKYLATGLSNCMKLESLTLGFNEIKKDGALELISALTNKSQLKALVLDGNNFGSEGKDAVRKKMIEIGKLNALGSLDDDDSIDSEDEEDTEEEQYQDDDGEDWEEIVIKEDEKIRFLQNNSHNQSKDDVEIIGNLSLNDKTVAVADFLNQPSADNFLGLGPNVSNLLLSEAEESNENHIEKLTEMLMKVGSLNVAIKGEENIQRVLKCTEVLFEELVAQSQRSDCLSIMNNFLLVYLGLIKSEDKKFKPTWNIDGCLIALHNVVKKNYMPESTKNTLKVFMQKEVSSGKDHLDLKKSILSDLK